MPKNERSLAKAKRPAPPKTTLLRFKPWLSKSDQEWIKAVIDQLQTELRVSHIKRSALARLILNENLSGMRDVMDVDHDWQRVLDKLSPDEDYDPVGDHPDMLFALERNEKGGVSARYLGLDPETEGKSR